MTCYEFMGCCLGMSFHTSVRESSRIQVVGHDLTSAFWLLLDLSGTTSPQYDLSGSNRLDTFSFSLQIHNQNIF